MFKPRPESILLETEYWRVTHNVQARLEGYLMIGTLESGAVEFQDVSAEGLAEFGKVVATVTKSIQETFQPKHVFVGRYGVMPGNLLHLHVVPVYDWLEERIDNDENYRFLKTLIDPSYGLNYDAADFLLYTWRELVEKAESSGLPPVNIPDTVAKLKPYFEELK